MLNSHHLLSSFKLSTDFYGNIVDIEQGLYDYFRNDLNYIA